jgi:hypothetical protein
MHLPRFALTRRHAALAALAALAFGLGVISGEWPLLYPQWREYRAHAPLQHYIRATELLHPRSGLAPSNSDLKAAIHHLRAITADSPMHREAAELLPLLELRMDRPQDFPAIEQARFLSCMAEAKAEDEELREQAAREHPCRQFLTRDGKCLPNSRCTTGLTQRCAPLAYAERLAQLRTLVPFR